MKWYISGKISGLPTNQVIAKFQQADSRGSRIEANIAEECGLQIVHQPEYATYASKM